MKILSVHNRYQIGGGEDRSCEAERKLLRDMGHQVFNYDDHNDRIQEIGSLRTAVKTIWSQESFEDISKILEVEQCNLMHVQNFFPLISPSIYYAAQKYNVPVVQSVRNYRLFCANGYFFRDNRVCEDCLNKFVPLPAIAHSCYRDSTLGSAVVATMLTTHRLLQTWFKQVDLFIALTEFSKAKLIEGGFPPEKIVVKPNFLHPDPGVGEGGGKYALFVGRLSPEKGIDTLLNAWHQIGSKLPLKIVGDGPMFNIVKQASEMNPSISCLGRKPAKEIYDLVGKASVLVFPSQWYEGMPRVIIEAFARGTPVIASNIGSVTELVDCGRTGFLFKPGNVQDLVVKVESFLIDAINSSQMRQEARLEFENRYTAEKNYQILKAIYENVL
jgi:glycosyltransferase involved in cell wall biosynthesis